MTFLDVLHEAANNKEFVSNFDRLRGTNLSLTGTNLELEIDKATGKLNDDLRLFIEFVYEYVWTKL